MIISILQIMNPMYAVCNITNAAQSTRLLASTTLRSKFQVRKISFLIFLETKDLLFKSVKHLLSQERIGNKNTSGDLERQGGNCSGGENQIMIMDREHPNGRYRFDISRRSFLTWMQPQMSGESVWRELRFLRNTFAKILVKIVSLNWRSEATCRRGLL